MLRPSFTRILGAGIVGALLLPAVPAPSAEPEKLATRYVRQLALGADEDVFAYSRISPDGKLVSYSSERRVGERKTRTVHVVDLETKRVLFQEPGLDSYWSPDGTRLIFLSTLKSMMGQDSIWHLKTGRVTRDIAPRRMAEYFTWAQPGGGRDLILTQLNWYFDLAGDLAARPYRQVLPCPGIGTGEQPMMSKDGRLIASFVRGGLAVRELEGCDFVLEIPLPGAKADFSYDGRYVAFHMPKGGGRTKGYEIAVVDIQERRLIPVTDLPGSSYYPSFTRDGRLSFRFDSEEFRGFVMASRFLANPSRPLPEPARAQAGAEGPSSLGLGSFAHRPEAGTARVVLVNFWAPWCAHCRTELPVLDRFRRSLRRGGADAEILGACEPGALVADRQRLLRDNGLTFPQLETEPRDIVTFGVQMFPTNLLFVDGALVERRYGAQTDESLRTWLGRYGVALPR